MFNLTPNNTQQPVTPYNLGLTPEQLAQMYDPNKGINEFAKALVSGVNTYTQGQQQQNTLKQQNMLYQMPLMPYPITKLPLPLRHSPTGFHLWRERVLMRVQV